jgi:hypothetical protein
MYTLIIVIGILSPTTSLAAGVTSQIVGKFEDLDQCKAAAEKPYAGGAISDVGLSRGIYWHCQYTGPK